MFFKSNKEIKTKDLKLADFDKIWTKFCFLDETGTLSDQKDQYFTVGILKMSQPYYLQSKIFYERSKIRFYDEVKFNKLSKNNVSFAKTIIDTLFETRSISFCSYSISTKSDYYLKRFDKNPWLAYEQITLKLLDATLSEQEIIVLIADHVTTPKDIRFEVEVKKKFNQYKGRLSLVGVCRFDSKSNDLLQLVDLLIGAVTYDIKFSKNLVDGSKYKLEVVDYLKRKLGADSFLKGFKNHNFNIFVDKTDHLDISQNNEANEKGLSS
ncbi:hypothetical protein A2641_03580 [Candidatus Nomurabacteria bacterium RIFCSPHIGHO2_01_FULL_37_25]|uniref:DUF3800 domain-containing protein n=1 Tax=Candidatus Nomurabacteria bacterium RIFCSPLOWO2_01_FULL_36_16 TaxID=1801767 RepID=A0A1F6WYB6_9BACT|nr:MAG: hypothetical protein A2641_03580 [Candidatus Nomurabacteria bacterium RIFCSPHIGHO2_01_FULL_37_25]OGI75119.1 MAG: hypothetical protein A3D36_00735 [Candidatus Nomurabacteria bacterium RIFCSPHIGHO2_02_FULL_36_29]OGI86774.1 MAG: hypothetical protein A3A91_00945 [Candidatus Nomurabacteria bacterium RIFCSPLOWO2_01_FULL_36_16]OGI96452.1 MAG: hypothetical protein A3I84_00450 [Candidatus Nomurabacteria bacterium RIFCSPLOWO2_02_FULL_36_8]